MLTFGRVVALFLVVFAAANTTLSAQSYSASTITNAFAANDISTTGTSVKAGWSGNPDDSNQLVTMPFSFTFWGAASTSMRLCTNGWLSPTDASNTWTTPTTNPSTTTPNNFIAPYFADLDFNTTYNPVADAFVGTTGTTPNRKYIVQYSKVPNHNGGTPISTPTISFVVIFYETTNVIEIH